MFIFFFGDVGVLCFDVCFVMDFDKFSKGLYCILGDRKARIKYGTVVNTARAHLSR